MRAILVFLALFELVQSAQLYFHPPVRVWGLLPPHVTSATVAKHLHLDRLTPLQENGPLITGDIDRPFVGQGSSSSLLIGVEDADAEYTVPMEDLRSPLELSHADSTSTLSEIIQTSLYRAPLAFSHVFDGSNSPTITFSPLLDLMNVSPQTETFVSELSSIVEFLEADHLSWDRFGAFRITGLRSIADAYGRDSEQYTTAAASLNAALRSAVNKSHLNLVIFTYPGVQAAVQKRQDQSPLPPEVPLPPVGSDTLCFASEEICSNSTDSCSGHGACVQANKAGRTCFVCACEASKDKGRTEYWAGSKCERKDVSGPFVLITGTVVALILTIVGSIAFLSSVGNQPLPSVLTGSVPGMSTKE
ncbi:hypothetical protein BJY52DRAFT_1121943 [Lactarius psammicola]|nr:hypothetical protein BJY52DRAFT_1121943 [Lactarius psammicola]